MFNEGFLPVTREHMEALKWERPDFVLVTGDAYIDHPSFGTAIIARVLEKEGFKVCILPQPNWRSVADFKKFGRPRLGFLVNSGNIDSMVNHYTAAKKSRSGDVYTENGQAGKRPDRAVIVYTNIIRQAYNKMPIIIGGVEASLRRFAHYDYWDDKVRRSILIDSGADMLLYGMGEKPIAALAKALDEGKNISQIKDILSSAYIAKEDEDLSDCVTIESYDEVNRDKEAYCNAFNTQQKLNDPFRGKRIIQSHGKESIIVNPPEKPLSQKELDEVYGLPYMRAPHPDYQGHIPALDEIEFSITSCRGCFGGCSFCALTFHQGRIIQSRSHGSILREARMMVKSPRFKGYIHDVGGPTANFRIPSCQKQLTKGTCPEKQCLYPGKCSNMKVSHEDYRLLLEKLRDIEGVKKVFVRSGLRYDYILYDKDNSFLKDLIEHHISGQLKIAPEHISSSVLEMMGKPSRELYERFVQKYYAINIQMDKEQYLVPYFMSSHPGSDLHAAIELACYMKQNNIRAEQVQDFYPTPGTLSTTMFHTGIDPRSMKNVYIPKSFKEKQLQRALLQYFRPENASLVRSALMQAERHDLIGFGNGCLIKPAYGQTDIYGNTAQDIEQKRRSNKKRTNKPKKIEKKNETAPKRQLEEQKPPKRTGKNKREWAR